MSMINAILDVAGPETYVAPGSGRLVVFIVIALLVVGGLAAVFVALTKRSKKKSVDESSEK